MEKKIKSAFLVLLFVITVSCNKDDAPTTTPSPTYQEENFLAAFLSQSGYDQEVGSTINDGNFYEFGVEFTPQVTGKITSIVIKQPVTNSLLRVTVWDEITGSIIKTEMVNVTIPNIDLTYDIVDIPLVKNKKYAITMNSNDYISHTRTNGSAASYPVTAGNIRIDSYKTKTGTAQTYPTDPSPGYAGDLSFNFLRTE